MPSLVKITAAMFPELHASLLRELVPSPTEAVWRTAFDGRWTDEDHFGHALSDGGRLVGMLGMLFSRRQWAGRTARFCNLHTWYVQPEYRGQSLLLMKPVLALRDHTVTDFTPSAAVAAISRRLGFSRLASQAVVLPLLRPTAANRGETGAAWQVIQPSATEMSPTDWQIYGDHQGLHCQHILLSHAHGYLYIVCPRIDRPLVPYCYVHYLSDRDRFVRHHATIRAELARRTACRLVVVDARLLAGRRTPFSFRGAALEKLYRPAEVAPSEIDTLYSEVVLFGSPALAGVRQQLRAAAGRLLPAALRGDRLAPGPLDTEKPKTPRGQTWRGGSR